MQTMGIVVDDPAGVYWEGALVELARGHQLESKGVVVLTIDPELLKLGALGGFHRRAWGAGVAVSRRMPSLFCPLMIAATRDHRRVEWAARVIHDARAETVASSGNLRLCADNSQMGAQNSGASLSNSTTIDLSATPVVEGGVVVRGSAQLSLGSDGLAGLSLYGSGYGARVVWLAAAVSR